MISLFDPRKSRESNDNGHNYKVISKDKLYLDSSRLNREIIQINNEQ